MTTVLLKNIGTLVSGRLKEPVLNSDAVLIKKGLIDRVGKATEMDEHEAETVIAEKLDMLVYITGEYWSVGKRLERHGFSRKR